jgi:hypothetical protein
MISFDVVSLFTKIPIPKYLDLLSKIIDLETLNVIKIFLTSTFFSFKDMWYEKNKGKNHGVFLIPRGI